MLRSDLQAAIDEFSEAIQKEPHDIDIAGYSGCVTAYKCPRNANCKRGLLYLYMSQNNITGHTCLLIEDVENCKCYRPWKK